MRHSLLATTLLLALPVYGYTQGLAPDQVATDFIQSANPHMLHSPTANAGGGTLGTRSNGSLLGIDSVPNWSSYFYEQGFDANGGTQYTWQYTMMGHSPFAKNDGEDEDWNGQTTRIGAPIVAVNVDLRDTDGSPRFINGKRLYMDATRFVTPVLNSPVFSNASYSSSENPTQFTDAIQRAEFFTTAGEDWHTLLRPRVAAPRTMVLPRGSYRFALKADGTCCSYILAEENAFLNAFFPATETDTSTPIGAAENTGDIRTRDLATFLFSNIFLYNGTPANCCIIGFHSYDAEPGSKENGWREKRYVLDYASWITPGLFRDPTFADVTALSHELAETFNDPFVNNATPWYLAPNGNCQNNLENGDGIEGLPNAQYAMSLNGHMYHPQNIQLLQWFAGVTPSMAIDHAYSYPDTSVLTSAAVPTTPGCQ